MGELDFAKKLIKILDVNILQLIIKKAVSNGFTVQGFNKNVWQAPNVKICAALERRIRGRYQSSIFMEALSQIESDDEIVSLAKSWLIDKEKRDEIEQKLEQISREQDRKTKRDVIIDEKKEREYAEVKKNANYDQDIQQLQTKNKKLLNTIQDLRISSENFQKEVFRLQKENGKLKKEIDEKIQKSNELQKEIRFLKESVKEVTDKLEVCVQENMRYKDIFTRLPRVLCFSKKEIKKEDFLFYNVEQIYNWMDEYEITVEWDKYKEIWIIETDFNYTEVVKMKKLPCKNIIIKRNVKSLIEKVGGLSDGYAR